MCIYMCVYVCFNCKSCRGPGKFEFLTLANLLCQGYSPNLAGKNTNSLAGI